MPFAAEIGSLEDREFFFWWEFFHMGRPELNPVVADFGIG
jgi:hypothetical protein